VNAPHFPEKKGMTRISRTVLISLSVLAGTRLALAQSGASPATASGSVGVVDIIKVFEDCDQIKDLNQLLKEANESYQKESEARKKVLAQKETELAAFAPDSPDYPPRRREFTRLSIEYNVWLQQSRADLAREHFNWTRVVYDECCKAVADVAASRGMSMVLQKRDFKPEAIPDDDVDKVRQMIHARNVVWSADGLDITDAVVKKMNERYRERGGRAKLKESKGVQPAAPGR